MRRVDELRVLDGLAGSRTDSGPNSVEAPDRRRQQGHVVQTLDGYRTGILKWFNAPIFSEAIEWINDRCGAPQRLANGYTEKGYVIAKLRDLHLPAYSHIGESLRKHCALFCMQSRKKI